MAITDSDITVVFQGPVVRGAGGPAELIRLTRRALPRSRCVLSTWTGADVTGIPFDRVVLSRDPGGLPGIKTRDGAGESNNVNRQIVSTQRGLQEVETDYAIKMRTDCALEHAACVATFTRFAGGGPPERILAPSLFTIDPLMFEQMPYHVSDWFQFGPTSALHRYWSAPLMSERDAVFYERHPHAGHSTFMDRRFRTRLAVEQYLAAHYAEQLGYPVPRYHNDVSGDVLEGHRRFLARHWVIVDPWDLGLRFSKYDWAYRSGFQRLNCLLFVDWYGLYLDAGGRPVAAMPTRLLARRRLQKQTARLLGRCMDKAGPLLLRPGLKQMVNRLLALLAWETERCPPGACIEPPRSLSPRP
jgi:hypothetical protein